MLFKKFLRKRRVQKLIQFIPGQDSFVKMIEKLRGLYEHPSNMLGREINLCPNEQTDVLVFAAHSDDDVLGVGTTLYRHQRKGDNVKIVFTTNGTADWFGVRHSWNFKWEESMKRSDIRINEAILALSLINIPKENITCLGFPDGGTHRYLKSMYEDVKMILQELKPGRVYVHCIEGGHVDHDITSFIVKTVCHEIGFHHVYEWAQYNPHQPLGTENIRFLPSSFNLAEGIIITMSEEEKAMKSKMLSFHKSQNMANYSSQGEAIRQANLSQLEKELFEFCQLPKLRLNKLIRKFHSSLEDSYWNKSIEVKNKTV